MKTKATMRIFYVMLITVLLFVLPGVLTAYQGDGDVEPGENKSDELRSASQNPMADLISIPVQSNTNFDYGPLDKTQNIVNIQPVVPFNLNDDWMMITRTILPIVHQPEFYNGQGSKDGLGDLNMSLFFGPADQGDVIWGAGPILSFPTASDERLGSEKWCAGPAAVVLTMPKPWVFGILAQNLWSYGGDSDRSSVNQMLIQYFVNYNLPNGWYLTSSPVITANWKADSDDRWTVPVGGGVGKLSFVGKLPLNISAAAFYNVEKPDNIGPRWTMRVQVQTLLPKSLF
ncbi:hypothetical protein JCM14469_40180 [Desulfatiferula olefinivorans]